MDMRPPNDAELAKLPHVLMTSDISWQPQTLDSEPDDLAYLDAVSEEEELDHWVDCPSDYGEEFSAHELNVYSCLEAKTTRNVKPPRSILPKMPNF